MAQTFPFDDGSWGERRYEIANPDGVESFFWEMSSGSNYPDYPTVWVILLGEMDPTRIVFWGGSLEDAMEGAAEYAAAAGYHGLVAAFGSEAEVEIAADARGELVDEGKVVPGMEAEDVNGLIWDRLSDNYYYTESGWLPREWRYEEHNDKNEPFYVAVALNSAEVVTEERRQNTFPEASEGEAYEAYCDQVLDGALGEWWEAPFCLWGLAATKGGTPHWHALVVDIELPWDDDDLNEHPIFGGDDLWWTVEDGQGRYLKDQLVLVARHDQLESLLIIQDYAMGRWDWSATALWPPASGFAVIRGDDKRGVLTTTAAAEKVERRRAAKPKQNSWPKPKVSKSQLKRIMRGAMK